MVIVGKQRMVLGVTLEGNTATGDLFFEFPQYRGNKQDVPQAVTGALQVDGLVGLFGEVRL